MKETEIIQLFTVIQNTHSTFSFDRFKMELWLDLLQDVPFELAQANLRRYCLNPENKFPPHPGVLAENPNQNPEGRYIPNAQETLLMLDNQDKLLLAGPSVIPESFRERMKEIANKPSHT